MGNSWKRAERKIACLLGKWACGNEDALRRMPLQGRMMEEYLGDIIVNEAAPEDVRKKGAAFLGKFMIDVKKRITKQSSTGWHFEQFLTSPRHQIFAWWRKLEEAARKYQKEPLLIITKGDRNWFILVDQEFFGRIVDRMGKTDMQLYQDVPPTNILINSDPIHLVAMNLFNFLKIPVEVIWPAEDAASGGSNKGQA
jgi:hypothetical protein